MKTEKQVKQKLRTLRTQLKEEKQEGIGGWVVKDMPKIYELEGKIAMLEWLLKEQS